MSPLNTTIQRGTVMSILVLGLCSAGPPAIGEGKLAKPGESDLARIVGQPVPAPFARIEWRTGEPPRIIPFIYAVESPRYDEGFLSNLARALGVDGKATRMPTDFLGAPGFWIKESNPTNALRWKAVFFSQVSGQIGYASGADNHRWDLRNQRPSAIGVPTTEEALQKTLALLPILGLHREELESNADGTIRWDSSNEGTTYTDRADGQRKRYIRQRNIMLWQLVPNGGSMLSMGGGGVFRAGFMSEGALAEFELLFRKVKPLRPLKPLSRSEILNCLRKGHARTFLDRVPDSICVTNCSLVYPQGNVEFKQKHLWPFYAVTGWSVEGNSTNNLSVYVPLAW